jgi:hypothetical protein
MEVATDIWGYLEHERWNDGGFELGPHQDTGVVVRYNAAIRP